MFAPLPRTDPAVLIDIAEFHRLRGEGPYVRLWVGLSGIGAPPGPALRSGWGRRG